MIDLTKVTLGAAAGAAVNTIIGGIGARLAMRAVVLLIGGQPAITPEGTLGILLLAAMLGVILGLLVATLHSWAGARWRQADWALGGLLAVLIAAIFLLNREGELALLPAWQVALLFAPLALLSTLATGWAYERLRRTKRFATARQAPATWLVAYGLTFFLALAGMISLAGDALRLPRVVWHIPMLTGNGADFAAAYAPMQLFGFLFASGYLLLTWLLFWRADSHTLWAAAVGCLLLAAGLFHVTGPLEALLGRGWTANMLEGLLALLGAAILAVVYWRLFTGRVGATRRVPLVFSLLMIAGVLAGLGALISVQPQWGVLRQPLLVTLFSVTLYLLPWLLLPLGLLLSRRTQHAGKAPAPGYPASALADLG